MEGTETGILCRFAAFVFRFVVLIYLIWPLMLYFIARKAVRYIWRSFGRCHGVRAGHLSRHQLRQIKQMRVHRYLEDQLRLVEGLIAGQNRVSPCEEDKDELFHLAGDEASCSDLDCVPGTTFYAGIHIDTVHYTRARGRGGHRGSNSCSYGR